MLPEEDECDENLSAVRSKPIVVSSIMITYFKFVFSISKSGMTLIVSTMFVLYLPEEDIVF